VASITSTSIIITMQQRRLRPMRARRRLLTQVRHLLRLLQLRNFAQA
jgi:hypothetical protein